MSQLPILMVGRRPEYVPMVTNNWMTSGRHRGLREDPRVWATYQHALIEKYWKDPDFVWLFAANPEDTNFVYGWLCGELTDVGPLLHYVYVRRRMRDTKALTLGVCASLMHTFTGEPRVPRITHTTTTPAFDNWASKSGLSVADEFFLNSYLAYDEFCPWRSARG